jgi:hypothetical protein
MAGLLMGEIALHSAPSDCFQRAAAADFLVSCPAVQRGLCRMQAFGQPEGGIVELPDNGRLCSSLPSSTGGVWACSALLFRIVYQLEVPWAEGIAYQWIPVDLWRFVGWLVGNGLHGRIHVRCT